MQDKQGLCPLDWNIIGLKIIGKKLFQPIG